MEIKTISKKQIKELEKKVDNGVFVAPARLSKTQEIETKKLIEQMKQFQSTFEKR